VNGLLAVLTEALVMLQGRAGRMGLDLTDMDFSVSFEPSPTGWRIYAIQFHTLYRVEGW
jgi:hypothetical protein